MTKELQKYFDQIDGVFHTTFNPNGPGVVRIHLIPPKKPKLGIPWVVIINGQDLLPLNTGWAILLAEFTKEVNKTHGESLSDTDIQKLVNETIKNVQKVFYQTSQKILKQDLLDIVDTLVNVAKGNTPSLEIGYITLASYAKHMRAPHRMDLMISAMHKNGCWSCNQKCIHCYAGDQPLAKTQELSTADWKKIIDACHEAYIPQLTFTGGEPTLRSDLVELVDYAHWFVTRVNTNGIRLTPELCDQLMKASLDSVQVTLYSSNKEIHNFLVGGDHFDETVAGIKNALAAGLNVSINTPLCERNKDYLETVQFAESLGVHYFSCSGLILTGKAKEEESWDIQLSKEDILQIVRKTTQYCFSHDDEISFTSPGWIAEEELRNLKLVVPSCGACLSNMAVTPSGDVVPCQSWLTDEPLGNLLTDSWTTIWNQKRTRELRKQSSKMEQVCPLSLRARKEQQDEEK
jgi:MoaA/NifB/PqqE/SkfB family radical SAM enzyme